VDKVNVQLSSASSNPSTKKLNGKRSKKISNNMPVDISDINGRVEKNEDQKINNFSQEKEEPRHSQFRMSEDKDVTFLFYMNGQFSDLEQSMASAMLGFEKAGSDKNVNVVAQLGRAPQREAHPTGGFDRIDNDWSGVRRYYVVKSENQGAKSLPVENWLKIKDKIPNNPLIHFTLGEIYSEMKDQKKAEAAFEIAQELGYNKFLDEPFHPDVGRWGDEFDKTMQPLRDKEAETNVFASPVKEFKGDADMMHPNSLKDFVSWGMKKYPAKHYVLALMGHGGAWTGANKMNPSEIGMAVEAGVYDANRSSDRNDHLDAMVFNSCYMGNLESIDQFKGAADITVASQMSARSSVFFHWPHVIDTVKKTVAAGDEFNPKKMAREFVQFYNDLGKENAKLPKMVRRSRESYLTLMALDNKKVDDLTKSWGKFIKDWKESGIPDHKVFGEIKKAKNYPSFAYSPDMMFDYGTLRDVGSIALNVMNNEELPRNLRRDCMKIRKALRGAIFAEQHTGYDMEGSSGLTVWAPTNAADVTLMKNAYKNSVPSFVQETGWASKLEDSLKNIDGKKMNEFLQTIQMLGNIRYMMGASSFSETEKKSLEHKSFILENEANQLRKEMDLSNPINIRSRSILSIEEFDSVDSTPLKQSIPLLNLKQSLPLLDDEEQKDIPVSENRKKVEIIKKENPLPDSDEERQKLQDQVVEGLIKGSDRGDGMGSTEFSRSMHLGRKQTF